MSRSILKRCVTLLTGIAIAIAMFPAIACAVPNPGTYNPDGWQWWKYAGNVENNSITDKNTVTDFKEAGTRWAVKFGSGWESSPTPPLIHGDTLYFAAGKRVVALNKKTGRLKPESEEAKPAFYKNNNVGYATNPPLYAEGKLFVQISNGSIQAVDAETLEPLWSTKQLKGQTISNLSYAKIDGKGFVYLGTWNGETRDGTFFAVALDDEGFTEETNQVNMVNPDGSIADTREMTQKVKEPVWTFTPSKDDKVLTGDSNRPRGFYWSGAYVTDKYLAVGTDDGTNEGMYVKGSTLYTLNPKTGEIIGRKPDIVGDIRTSICYEGGCLYYSTKGGHLHKTAVDANGNLGSDSCIDLKGMTTSTPVVYKGRVYIGRCGPKQFDTGGHQFCVVDAKTMKLIYEQEIPGYPQATPLLSTAYENEDFNGDGKPDGRVYIYFTYNKPPGGIYYFYDEPGRTTAPIPKWEDCLLYIPDRDKQQYCISNITVDSEGVLYFKNDSCHLFAVERNPAYLERLTVTASAGNGTLTMDDGSDLSDDPEKNEFDTRISKYTGRFTEVSEFTVKADPCMGAVVKVNGKSPDANNVAKIGVGNDTQTIKIEVEKTDAGKIYNRTYIVELRRVGENAKLGDIQLVSNGNMFPWTSGAIKAELSPEFNGDINEYITIVNKNIRASNNIRLWLTPGDETQDIKLRPVSNQRMDPDLLDENGFLKATDLTDSSGKILKRYTVSPKQRKRDVRYEATVTSGNGKQVETYDITVGLQYHVAGVTLDESELTVQLPDDAKLKASVTPGNADDKSLKWSSSDENVATVDENGVINAKNPGETTIRVTTNDGGYNQECRLTVLPADPADLAASKRAEELINALPPAMRIKLSDAEKVATAAMTYNGLTDRQKKLVSSSARDKLTQAESKIKTLKSIAAARARRIKSVKIKCKSRRFTISWTKTTGAAGYNVQYRLKGSRGWKTLCTATTKRTVRTKKLKNRKSYQFRVRTTNRINRVRYYGKWKGAYTYRCR